MEKIKIALIAHDNCKSAMVRWCRTNRKNLSRHSLLATGTTGTVIADETGLDVAKVLSGPKGGDLQIGSKIACGEIDVLIFFWDPLTAQPHDPDVKALLRIAALKNIPVATNQATADILVSSPLLNRNNACLCRKT